MARIWRHRTPITSAIAPPSKMSKRRFVYSYQLTLTLADTLYSPYNNDSQYGYPEPNPPGPSYTPTMTRHRNYGIILRQLDMCPITRLTIM